MLGLVIGGLRNGRRRNVAAKTEFKKLFTNTALSLISMRNEPPPSITNEAKKARISRWFSKDGEHMPIYYDRQGYARQVTRDEQDRWLAEGYGIVSDYVKSGATVFYTSTILLFLFAFGALPLFDHTSPSAPTTNVIVIVLALALFVFALAHQYVRYCFRINRLRNRIEARLNFRNPIPGTAKRQNAFAAIGRGAGILMFLAYGVIMLNNTALRAMFGQHAEIIFFSIVLGLYLISALGLVVMGKVDKAHIRQTGKWFRWLGRS